MLAGATVSCARAQFGRCCTRGHMQMTRRAIWQQGNEGWDVSNCATTAGCRNVSGLPCIAAVMPQAPQTLWNKPGWAFGIRTSGTLCRVPACGASNARAGRRHSGGRTWQRSCNWRSTPTQRRQWRPLPQGPAPAPPPAVDMFDCDGFTTTVTTIAMNSDDDDDRYRCSAGLLGVFPVHHDRSS